MRKLLNLSDWILLGIGGLIDVMEEIKDPLHLISNYYQTIHGYIPSRFKKSYLSKTMWRAIKTGNIEKIIKNGEVIYRLTGSGEEKLRRDFPLLFFQKQDWDGLWRVVIFDIEEEIKRVRELFRKKLKELGFGQLQKSIWITPHNILADFKEFVEERHLAGKVILLETEEFHLTNKNELLEKLWHITKLNDEYRKIYQAILKLNKIKNIRKKRGDRLKICEQLKHLKHRVINVCLKDPYLPKDLLPDDWWGEKARKLAKKISIFEK
jgi:phenylacetic acid degradation operon negative regulatory protein